MNPDKRAIGMRGLSGGILLLLILGVLIVYQVSERLYDGLLVVSQAPDMYFGVVPHQAASVTGVFTHTFFHSSWSHARNNAGYLFIFGGLLTLFCPVLFLEVTLIGLLVPGAVLWQFGNPDALYQGASLLVGCYLGSLAVFFLLLQASIPRCLRFLLVAFPSVLLLGDCSSLLHTIGSTGTNSLGHVLCYVLGAVSCLALGRREAREVMAEFEVKDAGKGGSSQS